MREAEKTRTFQNVDIWYRSYALQASNIWMRIREQLAVFGKIFSAQLGEELLNSGHDLLKAFSTLVAWEPSMTNALLKLTEDSRP